MAGVSLGSRTTELVDDRKVNYKFTTGCKNVR